MAKPRPTDAYFPENPQLSRMAQDIYDLLTDDTNTDTVYDDAEVVAGIAANAAAIAALGFTLSYTELISSDLAIPFWDRGLDPDWDAEWHDVDLSGDGVQEGDICDISLESNGAANNAGVRTDGSAIERRVDMEAETTLLRVKAGAGGIIEMYLNDASEYEAYLVGYERFSTS